MLRTPTKTMADLAEPPSADDSERPADGRQSRIWPMAIVNKPPSPEAGAGKEEGPADSSRGRRRRKSPFDNTRGENEDGQTFRDSFEFRRRRGYAFEQNITPAKLTPAPRPPNELKSAGRLAAEWFAPGWTEAFDHFSQTDAKKQKARDEYGIKRDEWNASQAQSPTVSTRGVFFDEIEGAKRQPSRDKTRSPYGRGSGSMTPAQDSPIGGVRGGAAAGAAGGGMGSLGDVLKSLTDAIKELKEAVKEMKDASGKQGGGRGQQQPPSGPGKGRATQLAPGVTKLQPQAQRADVVPTQNTIVPKPTPRT
jgi:hypothetical protein